jgi:hypothetical protein
MRANEEQAIDMMPAVSLSNSRCFFCVVPTGCGLMPAMPQPNPSGISSWRRYFLMPAIELSECIKTSNAGEYEKDYRD